jgi:hypothetical protein
MVEGGGINGDAKCANITNIDSLMGLMKMDTLQRYQQTIYPCAIDLVHFMPSGFCGPIL